MRIKLSTVKLTPLQKGIKKLIEERVVNNLAIATRLNIPVNQVTINRYWMEMKTGARPRTRRTKKEGKVTKPKVTAPTKAEQVSKAKPESSNTPLSHYQLRALLHEYDLLGMYAYHEAENLHWRVITNCATTRVCEGTTVLGLSEVDKALEALKDIYGLHTLDGLLSMTPNETIVLSADYERLLKPAHEREGRVPALPDYYRLCKKKYFLPEDNQVKDIATRAAKAEMEEAERKRIESWRAKKERAVYDTLLNIGKDDNELSSLIVIIQRPEGSLSDTWWVVKSTRSIGDVDGNALAYADPRNGVRLDLIDGRVIREPIHIQLTKAYLASAVITETDIFIPYTDTGEKLRLTFFDRVTGNTGTPKACLEFIEGPIEMSEDAEDEASVELNVLASPSSKDALLQMEELVRDKLAQWQITSIAAKIEGYNSSCWWVDQYTWEDGDLLLRLYQDRSDPTAMANLRVHRKYVQLAEFKPGGIQLRAAGLDHILLYSVTNRNAKTST